MASQLEITLAAILIWALAPIQAHLIMSSFVYRVVRRAVADPVKQTADLRKITRGIRYMAIAVWAGAIVISLLTK
jgi:hypothetical protein